jgi:hypothetical protein
MNQKKSRYSFAALRNIKKSQAAEFAHGLFSAGSTELVDRLLPGVIMIIVASVLRDGMFERKPHENLPQLAYVMIDRLP